jgi:1-acyl-sn-glycerol-3-phosphate acyltransferase
MKNRKKLTFYEKVYKYMSRFFKAIFRISASHTEKEPASGACILCANHTSLADVLIIAVSAKRQVRYMAKKELFSTPVVAPIIKALGAFPVDRGGSDVASIKHTLSLLEHGDLVGLFPQGTRHPGKNPRDTEVKSGVGMMVYRSKADVLPVFVKTKKNRTGFLRKCEVIFGDVIKYDDLSFTSGGSGEYKRATEYIFDKVCSLGEDCQE